MSRIFTKEHKQRLSEAAKRNSDRLRQKYETEGKCCADCGIVKPITEFVISKTTTLPIAYCKVCSYNRWVLWKTENPQEYIQSKKKTYNKYKDKLNKQSNVGQKKHYTHWLEVLQSRNMLQCSICGYNKNIAALDYHHINPQEKEYLIGQLMRRKITEERLKELDKVVCLCSNCHREIHHPDCKQYQEYKNE